MAGTDFTDKQLADHLAAFERGDGLPENSVLDFRAVRRGEPILRKMTPDEIKASRVAGKRVIVAAEEAEKAEDAE